jgi:hypothetical protein
LIYDRSKKLNIATLKRKKETKDYLFKEISEEFLYLKNNPISILKKTKHNITYFTFDTLEICSLIVLLSKMLMIFYWSYLNNIF